MDIKAFTNKVREYFNLRPHKENESEIIENINSGITFRGGNLWVLIFAILIASLGLNVNSTAVIIGAMLISPLMGPIIGIGFALGTMDLDMLKRSAKNFTVATVISILTATVYWVLTPLSDAQSELLARTSPTLYDVLIAFCGGAAGIIAICTKGKTNVIPGVAIATALMPPLCTAGFGLGTGNLRFFFGAIYLFFINTIFIAMATYAGVRFMHFKRKAQITPERAKRVRRRTSTIIIIFLIPATVMTFSIVQKSIFDNNVNKFIKNELTQSGTQIISTEIVDKEMHIVAVGREISEETQHNALLHMADYGLSKYSLTVIQGSQFDSALLANSTLQNSILQQQLIDLSTRNSKYEQQLEDYSDFETLCDEIANETKVLFPALDNIVMSRVRQNPPPANDETSNIEDGTYHVVAVAEIAKGKNLSSNDSQRLHQWLKSRITYDSVELFVVRKK